MSLPTYLYDVEEGKVMEITSDGKKIPVQKCTQGATEALVNALINCRTGHSDERQNLDLQYAIAKLAQLFPAVQAIDSQALSEFYRSKVGSATSWEEIITIDLGLNAADFLDEPRTRIGFFLAIAPSPFELRDIGFSLEVKVADVSSQLPLKAKRKEEINQFLRAKPENLGDLILWVVEAESVFTKLISWLSSIRLWKKQKIRAESLFQEARDGAFYDCFDLRELIKILKEPQPKTPEKLRESINRSENLFRRAERLRVILAGMEWETVRFQKMLNERFPRV